MGKLRNNYTANKYIDYLAFLFSKYAQLKREGGLDAYILKCMSTSSY